jgi:hypothetical protein
MLREYERFLLYHGKGYDQQGIGSMPVDDVVWHVEKLMETLKAEQAAIEQANKRAARRH